MISPSLPYICSSKCFCPSLHSSWCWSSNCWLSSCTTCNRCLECQPRHSDDISRSTRPHQATLIGQASFIHSPTDINPTNSPPIETHIFHPENHDNSIAVFQDYVFQTGGWWERNKQSQTSSRGQFAPCLQSLSSSSNYAARK